MYPDAAKRAGERRVSRRTLGGRPHSRRTLFRLPQPRLSRALSNDTDAGRITIGEYCGHPQPRTHDIAWEFKRCGVVCSVVDDLARERWRKLVWNIPFNGLSVVAGSIDTAKILGDEKLRLLALELMDETIAIARACGHNLPTALGLEEMKRTPQMGDFRPSTLMDYLAGRPLEIEPIWGEPLRRAKALGVAAPKLEELYQQLISLDRAARK